MARSPAAPMGTGLDVEALLASVPEDLCPLLEGIKPRRVARMVDVLSRRMASVVLVAEAVRRRHNVSAIIRTADALGLHEVHLITGRFRPSAGAARGSERWIAIRRHPTTAACMEALRSRGFRIFAADLGEKAHTPESVPVDGPVALLFGSELSGVSDEARAMVDGTVALPMLGFVESLNVSVAAALITRTVADRRRALAGADLSGAERHVTLKRWLERESSYARAAKLRGSRS